MSGGSVADATGNWADTLAPAWLKPYLRLARLDRPIGSWLLLLPCWWSVALAAIAAGSPAPSLAHIALFFVGAFAMRGAGCTWNDIVDRDLDASVERTRSRPIPSGQVSVKRAFGFLALQALVGFLVLISFNGFTIPALSSRKMETNVELGEGQSFVIAGLIDNQVTETISKIPGLSSLPILGNLFKSHNISKSDDELVVLVTPEITMPLQPGDAKPSVPMPHPFLVPVTPGSTDAFPTKAKAK